MENKETRGRGRPKGSKSFINTSLSQLNELFRKTQNIPVSRVWLENLNIDVKEENKTEVKNQKIEEENKIQMTLKN
jgi:hypothetical protein